MHIPFFRFSFQNWPGLIESLIYNKKLCGSCVDDVQTFVVIDMMFVLSIVTCYGDMVYRLLLQMHFV